MSPLYGGGRAEVECPGCGATIRARMADQAKHDGDLCAAMRRALPSVITTEPDGGETLDDIYDYAAAWLGAIAQAYVDSQVAAARADERAKVLAVIEQEAELRQDGAMGGPVWTVTLSEVRAAFAAEADHG